MNSNEKTRVSLSGQQAVIAPATSRQQTYATLPPTPITHYPPRGAANPPSRDRWSGWRPAPPLKACARITASHRRLRRTGHLCAAFMARHVRRAAVHVPQTLYSYRTGRQRRGSQRWSAQEGWVGGLSAMVRGLKCWVLFRLCIVSFVAGDLGG